MFDVLDFSVDGDDLFNTNLNSIDEKRIKELLQCILNIKFHAIPSKRMIHDFSGRLNFACPFCGDSKQDVNKKRGNFYFKTMTFKCFNCSYITSLSKFMEEYKDLCDLSSGDIISLKRYEQENKGKNLIFKDSNISDLFDIAKYGIPIEDFKDFFNLVPVDGTNAEKFLRNRYQYMFKKILYDKKNDTIFILNSNNSHVLGFQLRQLKHKKYYTYKLSKIYSMMSIDINDNIIDLDQLSTIFNILDINFNDIITTFEGPFDSFLYPNSIAISGAMKNIPFDVEYIRFWFDNDDTGKEQSIKMLKEGHKVFLWEKYLSDMKCNEKIKDLNDLVILSKKNNVRLLDFETYFSNSTLDMFYV